MVLWDHGCRDVLLCWAGEELLLQVAQWAREHRRIPIRLISSCDVLDLVPAAARSSFAVVDAGESPAEALEMLPVLREQLGHGRIIVYSSNADADLEVQVRSAGFFFVVGPLSLSDWEEILQSVGSDPAGAAPVRH